VSGLFAAHETIGAAVAGVQDAFAAALEGDGELTVAGAGLRVDQVRGIASMRGAQDGWTERDGKRSIRNDTPLGRAFLAYVVGAGRHLTSNAFEQLLTALVRADLRDAEKADLAQFVNLVAAEPLRDPRTELPVWAAVARHLAAGRGTAYFSQEIPELRTSYDPLHAEIAPGAQLAEPLLPEAHAPLEPTLERYEARLRAEAGGDLEGYVREHLLARVAQALS